MGWEFLTSQGVSFLVMLIRPGFGSLIHLRKTKDQPVREQAPAFSRDSCRVRHTKGDRNGLHFRMDKVRWLSEVHSLAVIQLGYAFSRGAASYRREHIESGSWT